MPKSNSTSSECKICGIPASYSHYGAIACDSCKVFFKRNAENRKNTVKCPFDGQCDINILNRHTCAACRLAKCFQVGMSIELMRSPHVNIKKRVNRSLKSIQMKTPINEQPKKISTLNLLEQDHSLLSNDEWTHLSNLIHSYDEHNVLPIAKNFMIEIDSLHPKLRFKIDSKKIVEIMRTGYQMTELFIQSNRDFTLLPIDDRSIVLHGAVDNVSCLGSGFIMHQSELITNLAFRNGLEITYGSIPYNLTLNVISLLDQDINLVKLTLSLFAFCTSNCTLFNENDSLMYLKDIQSFLRIQDMYAELIWKYLLYTSSFERAVIRFSQLVKCIVTAFTIRTHLQTVRYHTDVLDVLIQKIEQQHININEN